MASDGRSLISWFRNRADATVWGGPEVPFPLTSEWFAEEFAKDGYWVWEESPGELAGVFRLVGLESHILHIMRFAIAPAFRGRRLARTFLGDILQLARSLEALSVSLNVYGSNAVARHLYVSAGFAFVGERLAPEDPSGVSHKMRVTF